MTFSMEQLSEVLPIDYDDEFYKQFRDWIGAYYNLPALFLGYMEGHITREPSNEYEEWAQRNGLIERWPYPEIGIRWKAGDYSWREVSRRIYWDQLECVPPVRMDGGAFMVGEAWTYGERGEIHTAFVKIKSRYFCRHDYLRDFDSVRYRREIRAQFYKEESKDDES